MLRFAPTCPVYGLVQIRLDKDLAKIVKRNALAHRRIFKRPKSYASVVNEALRDSLNTPRNHNPMI